MAASTAVAATRYGTGAFTRIVSATGHDRSPCVDSSHHRLQEVEHIAPVTLGIGRRITGDLHAAPATDLAVLAARCTPCSSQMTQEPPLPGSLADTSHHCQQRMPGMPGSVSMQVVPAATRTTPQSPGPGPVQTQGPPSSPQEETRKPSGRFHSSQLHSGGVLRLLRTPLKKTSISAWNLSSRQYEQAIPQQGSARPKGLIIVTFLIFQVKGHKKSPPRNRTVAIPYEPFRYPAPQAARPFSIPADSSYSLHARFVSVAPPPSLPFRPACSVNRPWHTIMLQASRIRCSSAAPIASGWRAGDRDRSHRSLL